MAVKKIIGPECSSHKDFDFFLGKWKIENRRLKNTFVNSDEWTNFPATNEVRSLMNGLASMDQFFATRDGEYFEGVSIRVFDPETRLWSIYWMDTRNPRLTEPVIGYFENGIGTFSCEEMIKGEMTSVRFLWSDITENSARWEQALYDKKNEKWEVNWVMEFTRVS